MTDEYSNFFIKIQGFFYLSIRSQQTIANTTKHITIARENIQMRPHNAGAKRAPSLCVAIYLFTNSNHEIA